MTLPTSTTMLVKIMPSMPMAILRGHLPLTECTHTRIAASGPYWRKNSLTCGLPAQARSGSLMRVADPVHGYADWSYARTCSDSAGIAARGFDIAQAQYNGRSGLREIFPAFQE